MKMKNLEDRRVPSTYSCATALCVIFSFDFVVFRICCTRVVEKVSKN